MLHHPTKWVFFAGAPETGKSSAARILQQEVQKQTSRSEDPKFAGMRITTQSTIRPVSSATMSIFGCEGMDYHDFKNVVIHGKTGREWIIRITEDVIRKDDQALLSRLLVERVMAWRNLEPLKPTLVLIENLGFKYEYEFYRRLFLQPDVFGFQHKMCVVYMRRDGYDFARVNDSRQDISSMADWKLNHPLEIRDVINQILYL